MCVCLRARVCRCVCVWGKQAKKEKRRGSADRQKSIQSKSNKVEKSHNNGWFLFVVDVKRQQQYSNNSSSNSSSSSSNNRRDSRPTSQPGEAGGRCGGTSREGRVKHKKGGYGFVVAAFVWLAGCLSFFGWGQFQTASPVVQNVCECCHEAEKWEWLPGIIVSGTWYPLLTITLHVCGVWGVPFSLSLPFTNQLHQHSHINNHEVRVCVCVVLL